MSLDRQKGRDTGRKGATLALPDWCNSPAIETWLEGIADPIRLK
jgi:hypothetical protein